MLCVLGLPIDNLIQRERAEEIPRFQLNIDRVTTDRRLIDSAICCVQSFVRDPLFTQRDFFIDIGILTFLSAVKLAASVCEDSVCDPWKVILPEGYAAVVVDLKRTYDGFVFHRKDARDSSERCFGVASVESSVAGESSGQQAVRLSNVVEIGEEDYLPQSVSTMQTPLDKFRCQNPRKRKKKKSETPAKAATNRRFEFDDESVVLHQGRGVYFDESNFSIALRDEYKTLCLRRSRCNGPVFQSRPR